MEPVSLLTVVGLSLTLIINIWKEYFTARAEAKKRNEEFKLTKTVFLQLVDNALLDLRTEAKKESQEAGDLEDRVDQDLGRKN